ncbi:speckle-type POZ protein-like [Argiope bruennichi]|uniref:speckle-type POZ protein-like n=1 Tax=Argiope bruennichi TaxID=94029 RepID=UPI0024941E05|nr:speckle-type POZ protein-like [Argiope bruennichi]
MSNLHIYILCFSAAVLVCTQLFSSSNSSGSHDEVQIKTSELRMVDLCESMSLLFQKGLFSDLTVVADGEFKVHKGILSARSEVFHQMLESQRDLEKIVIDGISKTAMVQMLFFIYTGHTEELSVEVAVELFKAADKYKLHLLKSMCSDILMGNLNLDNLLEFLSLAVKHSDENLQNASVDFIVDNILAIREHNMWLKFVETHPHVVVNVLMVLASKK